METHTNNMNQAISLENQDTSSTGAKPKIRRHSGDDRLESTTSRKRNWSGETRAVYPQLDSVINKETKGTSISPQIEEIITLCKKFSISIKGIAEDQNNIKKLDTKANTKRRRVKK